MGRVILNSETEKIYISNSNYIIYYALFHFWFSLYFSLVLSLIPFMNSSQMQTVFFIIIIPFFSFSKICSFLELTVVQGRSKFILSHTTLSSQLYRISLRLSSHPLIGLHKNWESFNACQCGQYLIHTTFLFCKHFHISQITPQIQYLIRY